ncbi:tyrosine-type recombinase/integrase [Mycolicibacterium mageritense]|uniref:tyrosine-type recombinase/integrase n=1 Tax=Mycolicibacterium mageritense TaxID=53462 RepID=UPI001E480BFC|nr:tyrosine-type recombinase/integrase [Mycolicibacterium mageritense]
MLFTSLVVVGHDLNGGLVIRAFPVTLPSGDRYWTVFDDDRGVVSDADAYLRHVRFGQDRAETTTRSYAGGIALYLRWCRRTDRDWVDGLAYLGLFITWLRHFPARGDHDDVVAVGPGSPPARGARRINGILVAVRGFAVFAATRGIIDTSSIERLYELADDRDVPVEAKGETGQRQWRLRPLHRLHEPETPVDRASDEEIVALLRACRSTRDRLIVLLLSGAGLRRGELTGLRRSDLHLLPDSTALGCPVQRAHLHVERRSNPNGAWAKSRRCRHVPLGFLIVQAFDVYEFERFAIPRARDSDFVFVNLFREPIGSPMLPDAINSLLTDLCKRAALDRKVTPHQLRHAFGSNLLDAGGAIDEAQMLLGHVSASSTQVYLHPDRSRLREAVERVPLPRDNPGAAR